MAWEILMKFYKCNFQTNFRGISCEIALIWMSLDFTDDQPTLVQVMAWCRQATSHYLSQCWPRSLSPYGVTRLQWVKIYSHSIIVFCNISWLSTEFENRIKYTMTSSNGNILCVTGHLCGEFTGHRWILHTKASDAELWCFLWSASE